MNYTECKEIIGGSTHLIDMKVNENFEVTDNIEEEKYHIVNVIVAPSNKGLGRFKQLYGETNSFEEAIKPFLSYQDLEVNFFVKDLETGEFAFFPFKYL